MSLRLGQLQIVKTSKGEIEYGSKAFQELGRFLRLFLRRGHANETF